MTFVITNGAACAEDIIRSGLTGADVEAAIVENIDKFIRDNPQYVHFEKCINEKIDEYLEAHPSVSRSFPRSQLCIDGRENLDLILGCLSDEFYTTMASDKTHIEIFLKARHSLVCSFK